VSIQSDKQQLSPSPIVVLYQLDARAQGLSNILYFTKNGRVGTTLPFDGNNYTPVDIEVTGYSTNSSGSFASPTMRVANIAGLLTSYMLTTGDFVGAKLTRIRTHETYLDDGATPDPLQTYRPDVYTVEQLTNQNKIFCEWRLSSVVEEVDRLLPGRVCMRDFCSFVYRQWDTVAGAFVDVNTAGSQITCPYTGTRYFDENDKATTAANDVCGKTLNSCALRFGVRSEIKFGGFPGVGRGRAV